MRVLVVSQYFPPETGAAPARAGHFVRAMERAGHQVRVVTGLPNHPSGEIQREFRGARRRAEQHGQVRLERVWLYATPRKTALRRLWNQLSFAGSALPAVLGGPRPDVVFATMPPLFLGATAWVAARRWGVPLVTDVRDDWPHAAVALGELRPGLPVHLLDGLARLLFIRSALLTVVTPALRRRLASRGHDEGRIEVVSNGADTELFQPDPEPAGDSAGPIRVLYAGTHGRAHGMEVILDAARELRDPARWRFVFVGDGVAKASLQQRAAADGMTNVEFRPSVPPEQLVGVIRDSHLCVVTTTAHEFLGEIISVKVFDYLACARPVVGAVTGETARVVEESGGGVVVPPGDAAALAGAIRTLAADPSRCTELGRAGRVYVDANYSRRALGDRLVTLLEDAVRRSVGRTIAARPAGWYAALKRLLDVVVAGTLLIALSPLLLLVAIAIRLGSSGPALYRQRRIGRGSAEFIILKFRTMRAGTPDLASHLVGPGSDRVTRIGRLLRRTSVDELPQLWNILMGQMSLVGPRPALYNQDDLIAMRQAAGVDALRPGVTGWAQIHGRDDLPLQQKVDYDRYYREHCSLLLDVWILIRTPLILFSSRGVY